MSPNETKEIKTLRTICWERAKGELNAMLCTYYGNPNFEKMEAIVTKLIKKVEEKRLQE